MALYKVPEIDCANRGRYLQARNLTQKLATEWTPPKEIKVPDMGVKPSDNDGV